MAEVGEMRNEMCLVEGMSSLAIKENELGKVNDYPERDSANQSPLDCMLANSHSDAHSEASNDSGKGGSDYVLTNGDDYTYYDMMTPPTSPPVVIVPLVQEEFLVYEFEIPQTMCGLLIGKNGTTVNSIRAQTGANIIIRKNRLSKRIKICAVEGTRSQIEEALAVVRATFPLKNYPCLTLNQVNVPEQNLYVLPDSIQLQLSAGFENNVLVSALVSPQHLFLQDVGNPSFSSLAALDLCMAQCYNEYDTPSLPTPVQTNLVCAAPLDGGWYRAKVVEIYENEENEDLEVEICYVDYGGYARVPVSSLRQIRADFISLPFQAIECLLANISPVDGKEWSAEACTVLEELTRDQVLQAEIVGYTLEGLPLVLLNQGTEEGSVLINRELVDRGVAVWIEPQVVEDTTTEEP